MGRVSNRQIVEELNSGDRRGAAHLLEMYQNRLISECVEVFHIPKLDSEEIVSDVLLTVIQKINTFRFTRSDGDFHFWVMTVFRNRVRDFVRHQALTEGLFESFDESILEDEDRYTETEFEVVRVLVSTYEASLRDPEDDAEQSVSSKKLKIVADVLESLETWERVLLRCRALDVSYEDISVYTGKPVSQLKVYHARVKKKFMNLLVQHSAEFIQR